MFILFRLYMYWLLLQLCLYLYAQLIRLLKNPSKIIEVDRLIDMVSDANPREVNAIYIFNLPCN